MFTCVKCPTVLLEDSAFTRHLGSELNRVARFECRIQNKNKRLDFLQAHGFVWHGC